MDNTTKFRLSRYKGIRGLNSKKTAYLVYDIQNDKACVKKSIDNSLKDIYTKLYKVNNSLLPEIYEIIDTESDFILIEEYIRGKSIDYIVKNEGVINNENACRYVIDIAGTLSVVHNLGIVHRDITPNNIIIDDNNRARLLDFDIARTTGKNQSTDTTILGTVGFASPEQFGFAQTDARSDIYSLGVLLNYMVTGHIIQDKVSDNSYIRKVIEKSTKINPEDRYKSVAEMINDIKKYTVIKYNTLKESEEENAFFRFLSRVPGFRTNHPVKGIIAVFLYICYISEAIDYLIVDFNLSGFIFYTICYITFIFIPMWWFGDKGRRWDIVLPFLKNKDKKIKTIYAILLYIVVLIFLIYMASNFK